ncbi:MAG: hypothetical protein KAT65_12955 [Methanophagales archaeon]|nr:hypothetical protein [Methanophagales archaeon]
MITTNISHFRDYLNSGTALDIEVEMIEGEEKREVVKDSMHRTISEKVECISGRIFEEGKKWQPRLRYWGKC